MNGNCWWTGRLLRRGDKNSAYIYMNVQQLGKCCVYKFMLLEYSYIHVYVVQKCSYHHGNYIITKYEFHENALIIVHIMQYISSDGYIIFTRSDFAPLWAL